MSPTRESVHSLTDLLLGERRCCAGLAELGDQLAIAKLNVDEHPEIAMRYSVMSIPTLLLIQDGDVKKKIVGAKGKGALMQELGEFLGTSL